MIEEQGGLSSSMPRHTTTILYYKHYTKQSLPDESGHNSDKDIQQRSDRYDDSDEEHNAVGQPLFPLP